MYACSGNGCLHPGQGQGWGLSWLSFLQVCTLLLATAASAVVESSIRARGAGGGPQCGLRCVCWGDPGKPARAPASLHSASSALGLRVNKHVSAVFMSGILVSYSPLVSLTGFQNSQGGLFSWLWTPDLGFLICGSNTSLPREDP